MTKTPLSADGSEKAEEEDLLRQYVGRTWCVLHTRSRHEKKVVAACQSLRVPAWLPLRVSRTVSGGKVNTFQVPVFAGYVFAALGSGELVRLKRTNSVAQRIETRDESGLLKDLRGVRVVQRAQLEVELAPRFQRGQRVLVTAGPLAGVAGVVVRYKNSHRLQVSVEAIQQAVLVDVPAEDLAPVT